MKARLLLFFLSICEAAAFVLPQTTLVTSRRPVLSSPTRRYYSDDEPPNSDDQGQGWIELPRPTKESNPAMTDAEQWVGRIAMIGAVGLFLGEVTTGESVPQQVMDALAASPL